MTENNYLLFQGEDAVTLAGAIALVDAELLPVQSWTPYRYSRTFAKAPTTNTVKKILELASKEDNADFYEQADIWVWQVNQITRLDRSHLINKVKEKYETCKNKMTVTSDE